MGLFDFALKIVGKEPAEAPPPKIDPKRWIADVELEKGPGYATEVDTALAYLRGHSRADTRKNLMAIFPETGQHIPIVSLNIVQKIARETAQAFSGDGKFELLDAKGNAVTTSAKGTLWSKVIEDCNLAPNLREADRQCVTARRVFPRATWDAPRGAVRIALFPPSKVWPRLPRGERDCRRGDMLVETAPAVIDGRLVKLYEVWLGGDTPASLVIDEKGKPVEVYGNDYLADDGDPYVPFVEMSLDSIDAGKWTRPEDDLMDGARAVNKDTSSLHHVADMQGYGQWTATPTDTNAEQWTEKVILGPDEIAKFPRGWDVDHKAQAAPLAELSAAGVAYIEQLTAMRSLPPGSVVASTRATPSGIALEVERMPLKELRADACAIYRQPVHDLLRLIRIVWNAHNPDNKFEATSERWTPGEFTGPPDRERENRIAQQEVNLGLTSPVRELMRREKMTEEAAIEAVAKIAAENKARTGASMADVAAGLRLPGPTPAPAAVNPLAPKVP